MSNEVRFPVLSSDQASEGLVATWFVADGESVKAGQLIAEVQVDKVSAEVQAPTAGLIRIIAGAQATVKQEAVIAVIE